MKHNYPIKYAVMPIKDKERRDSDWYDICYVIVKCYVIEERKHYKLDGTNYTNYFVVCPYHFDQTYFHWVKSPPDSYYGEWVRHVYDTYEEALEEKEIKNAKVSPLVILDDEERRKQNQLFNDQVELFKQFEKDVEAGTKELKVNGKPKEQTIITMSLSDNKLTMRDLSFYDAIQGPYYGLNEIPYIAYTVSSRTFKMLKGMESLMNVDIKEITKTPLLMNSKDNKFIKFISPKGNVSYLEPVHNYHQFYGYNEANYIEPEKIDTYIFTLENYKDMIDSYGFDCPEKKLSYSEGRRLILKRFYNS